MPDAGTTAINLFLYADGGGARRTINEYANVSVVEVASLPSLALLSSPQSSAPPSSELVVIHSSYSEAWQGSAGKHVLVDGMLNGWLVPPATTDFNARYGPRTLVQAAQWASLTTLSAVLVAASYPWIRRRTRRRERNRSVGYEDRDC